MVSGFPPRSSRGRFGTFALALWVAIVSASRAEALVPSEIQYHPAFRERGVEEPEFIEFFNDSSIAVDLSGAHFSSGIDFVFPEDTYLPSRAYLVVTGDRARLLALHPEIAVLGNFTGRLDNGGEEIALSSRSGTPLARIRYSDRGEWPAAADGTGFSLSLRAPFADSRDPRNWTWSAARGGSPGRENFPAPYTQDRVLLDEKDPEALWSWRKAWDEDAQVMAPFSAPPGVWKLPDYDGSHWLSGRPPFGFGETEIVTRLDDMPGHYLAFALRRNLVLERADLESGDVVIASLRVDDGCVVYWNGVEIGRSGLAGLPSEEPPFDAAATASRELRSTKALEFAVPHELLREGENLIAIQVHNQSLTSNDAGLAPSILSRKTIEPSSAPKRALVINEITTEDGTGSRSIELYNASPASLDLSGVRIALGLAAEAEHVIPAGTYLAPGGFRLVEEGPGLEGPSVSVVLYSPDGDSILDAFAFTEVARGVGARSRARFPDGADAVWTVGVPTPGEPNRLDVERDLVFGEIHYRPKLLDTDGRPLADPSAGEFVEIFNRSARVIDLSGYRLVSGLRFAFESGRTLDPGAYLVVARDPAGLAALHALDPSDVLGPDPGAGPEALEAMGRLSDGGETLRLEDPLGNPVDEVRYADGGDWEEDADGGGSSLELIDPRGENDSGAAWEASDESGEAPWVEISYEAVYSTTLVPAPMEHEVHLYLLSAGECLIDRVSVLSGPSLVESVPNGDFEVDTRPWRLTGTHIRSFRTTAEARSGTASLHLVATGAGDNRVNRIEVDGSPPIQAGKVRVSLQARWIRGSNALHVSGYNNAFGRTVWLPMAEKVGTPGRENGATARRRLVGGSLDAGPVISELRHAPAVPTETQPVVVSARVTDPDGVATVEVVFQKDGDAAWTRLPLRDDGTQGDVKAEDGVYSGTIPSQAKYSVVSFRIEAADAEGHLGTYPQADDGTEPVYVVDEAMKSAVLRYRLVVNRENSSAPSIGLSTRLLHSDELVHGSFVFEESEVRHSVGLRYHGSPWNRPPDPKMFRVRLPGDRTFPDGCRRMNLSRYGIAQNEGTAYHLVEKTSVPGAVAPHTPRYQYVALRLNHRAHGSVMAEVRPIDGEYAKYNWPEDEGGAAWKVTGKLGFNDAGQMQGTDWSQLKRYTSGPYPGARSSENYRFYFNPALREDEDLFDPLIDLLETMDRTTTPDLEYDAKIGDILNVEATLRVFAVRSLLADWDTVGIGNGQNAYLYWAPIEGRHYLLPWDMDHTFERTDVAVVPPGSTTGIGRLVSRPAGKRLYARILREGIEGAWSEEHVARWTSLVAETAKPAFVADPAPLVSFLRTRRGQVSTFLASAATAVFDVTTPSPTSVLGEEVSLAGTAPVAVAMLFARVNEGEVTRLEATWAAPPQKPTAIPTLWKTTLSGLVPGSNRVEVFALDGRDEIVGVEVLEVHDARAWEALGLDAVEPASGPMAGGSTVTLRGSGFIGGIRVEVGGAGVPAVEIVSEHEARTVIPPGSPGPAAVEVARIDGATAALPAGFRYEASSAGEFIRGDVDGRTGVTISDAVAILEFLFRGGPIPGGDRSCLDAADADDDGRITVSDPIRVLLHLFDGGAEAPPPSGTPGTDPTPDVLDCDP